MNIPKMQIKFFMLFVLVKLNDKVDQQNNVFTLNYTQTPTILPTNPLEEYQNYVVSFDEVDEKSDVLDYDLSSSSLISVSSLESDELTVCGNCDKKIEMCSCRFGSDNDSQDVFISETDNEIYSSLSDEVSR
ncbi:hypothetical protein TUBRATIS_009790 [Tubulinosema ratisbonensis]|uniref:Uncharacterized protein n=1 Tax=Tubulinosema ratisbonensis TaxID=291195 RepID=A0A437AMX4_9MICR|nr:hypothetical protein TUBRATIS_009790 [Tubulinosema ratisbonensis]